MESSFARKLTKWLALSLIAIITLGLGAYMPVLLGIFPGVLVSLLIGFIGGSAIECIGYKMDRWCRAGT